MIVTSQRASWDGRGYPSWRSGSERELLCYGQSECEHFSCFKKNKVRAQQCKPYEDIPSTNTHIGRYDNREQNRPSACPNHNSRVIQQTLLWLWGCRWSPRGTRRGRWDGGAAAHELCAWEDLYGPDACCVALTVFPPGNLVSARVQRVESCVSAGHRKWFVFKGWP